MKITYFSIEDIDSGLFKSQVLNKLNAILEIEHDLTFQLVVFNSPWKILKHRRLLKAYRSVLSERIKINYYPVLPPLRTVLTSVIQSKLIFSWLRLIAGLLVKINGDVIHCRSYWPTLIALKTFKKPIVFDIRSLYVAESVAAGKLKIPSFEYDYWLNIEKFCLSKSTVNSVVSEPMITYVKKNAPLVKVEYNPIIVNTDEIFFDVNQREELRKQLLWEDKTIIVYSGSLGYGGINKVSLTKLLTLLSKSVHEVRFLFLTDESPNAIIELLTSASISPDTAFITKAKPKELYKWLSAADIGIHALPAQLDSDTRLGTKVVEYWSNGLPVILNEHVGAAVKLAEKYNLGIVVSENDDNFEANLQHRIIELKQRDRTIISDIGRSLFDSKTVAKGYINIYKYCLETNYSKHYIHKT